MCVCLARRANIMFMMNALECFWSWMWIAIIQYSTRSCSSPITRPIVVMNLVMRVICFASKMYSFETYSTSHDPILPASAMSRVYCKQFPKSIVPTYTALFYSATALLILFSEAFILDKFGFIYPGGPLREMSMFWCCSFKEFSMRHISKQLWDT